VRPLVARAQQNGVRIPEALNALRGSWPGDLLEPVSRGLLRVDDRATSLGDYERPIKTRLEQFKAAIATPPVLSAAG
jgi:orotidine-5'-phosphate decarboxylase